MDELFSHLPYSSNSATTWTDLELLNGQIPKIITNRVAATLASTIISSSVPKSNIVSSYFNALFKDETISLRHFRELLSSLSRNQIGIFFLCDTLSIAPRNSMKDINTTRLTFYWASDYPLHNEAIHPDLISASPAMDSSSVLKNAQRRPKALPLVFRYPPHHHQGLQATSAVASLWQVTTPWTIDWVIAIQRDILWKSSALPESPLEMRLCDIRGRIRGYLTSNPVSG